MPTELKNLLASTLMITCVIIAGSALILADRHNPVRYSSALFLALAMFLPAEWPEGER